MNVKGTDYCIFDVRLEVNSLPLCFKLTAKYYGLEIVEQNIAGKIKLAVIQAK